MLELLQVINKCKVLSLAIQLLQLFTIYKPTAKSIWQCFPKSHISVTRFRCIWSICDASPKAQEVVVERATKKVKQRPWWWSSSQLKFITWSKWTRIFGKAFDYLKQWNGMCEVFKVYTILDINTYILI